MHIYISQWLEMIQIGSLKPSLTPNKLIEFIYKKY